MHAFYPQPQQFENYVPPEFEQFRNDTVKEWETLGMLKRWDQVRKPGDPFIPTVVSPVGVEPSKPRALWDGRYVNEFCRDMPFTMDNAVKVVEIAWENVYFFKMHHKNGYHHVPIHEDSWKFFEGFGRAFIMYLLSFHLGRSLVLSSASLSRRLWLYIVGLWGSLWWSGSTTC